MGTELRVLVYSPSAAVMAGITTTLDHDADLRVAHRISSPRALAAHSGRSALDVAILHGTDTRRAAAWRRRGGCPVIMAVDDTSGGAEVLRAARAGVTALVCVDSDLRRLPVACRDAAGGQPYISPGLTRRLLLHLAGRERVEAVCPELTAKESQALRLLASGHSMGDIGRTMCIGTRTVKHHLGNVYRKLEVSGQTEAVVLAYRQGLVA
nr:response regulator transcription factor [Micromonospora sp. DSM 115978]